MVRLADVSQVQLTDNESTMNEEHTSSIATCNDTQVNPSDSQ